MNEVKKDLILSEATLADNTKRENAIAKFGKILHIAFGGGDLSATAKRYLKLEGRKINIDDHSRQCIENFKKEGKGVIFMNHESAVFTDYLPLFAELGDEVVNKMIAYSGAYNLKMNNNEFSKTQFKAASTRSGQEGEDIQAIKEGIGESVDFVEAGGYVFVIIKSNTAQGEENTEKGWYGSAIAKKILEELSDDIPVLSAHIHHDDSADYKSMGKNIIKNVATLGYGEKPESTLDVQLTKASDWRSEKVIQSNNEPQDGEVLKKKKRYIIKEDFYNQLHVKNQGKN